MTDKGTTERCPSRYYDGGTILQCELDSGHDRHSNTHTHSSGDWLWVSASEIKSAATSEPVRELVEALRACRKAILDDAHVMTNRQHDALVVAERVLARYQK